LPQRIAGRDLFRYLDAIGVMRVSVDSRLGQRLRYRDTLIGSSPRAARERHGIRLRERTVDAQGPEVAFEDGGRLAPAAVIWATGFAIDHSWVHVPVFDDAARLMHQRGVTSSPGLYFLGLTWQYTRGSALLGWVKDDAVLLAAIGAIYFGFAVADGRTSAMVVQAISALVFLNIAFFGVQQESDLLLGLGFLAHAGWDWIHHEGHGPTRVRTWYPPFCVVADVVIAVPILAGWV
jgi:hypothetical protein